MKNPKSLEIELQNPECFETIPSQSDCVTWIAAAIENIEQDASVVVRFVDKDESQTLNHRYRQKDSSTNVLSFPFEMPEVLELQNEPKHLGDLVLCVPVILKEAKDQNKQVLQHWAHLIIHGTLHLQGYDHIDETEADIMESLEIEILKHLGFDNPYE